MIILSYYYEQKFVPESCLAMLFGTAQRIGEALDSRTAALISNGIPPHRATFFGLKLSGIERRKVACAIAGTWLEYYDFTAFGFFAISIGRQFFPGTQDVQLLLTLGTFAAGFIMRPIGAGVLGIVGDRYGRKTALTLTIALMFLGTAILIVTPSYAQIGIAAPICVIIGRFIQGFSAGGEIGTATTYLLASVPKDKAATYGSFQTAVQGMAGITASFLGYCAARYLPAEQMDQYGWRIALAFGLLIGPVGLYLRTQIQDDVVSARQPVMAILKAVFVSHSSRVVVGLLVVLGGTTGAYIITNYLTTFAINTLKMPSDIAFLISIVSNTATVGGAIAGGRLADRYGKLLLMALPQGLFVLMTYPALLVITGNPSDQTLLLLVGALAVLRSMSGAVAFVALAECFLVSVRATGLSLTFSIGVALFGGTAQLIATWLLHATGNPMSLAWYLIATNSVTFCALFFLYPVTLYRTAP
ncbi:MULTISPECIES: MFS transporter [Rhizobium]|uniref:MFS transporter n=1 Tax=Rhizobium TaxID=379 RepID=UPI00142DB628|nr:MULTISPECIES: MFS transporter [Rhizobium]